MNETRPPRKYVYDSLPLPSLDNSFTKGLSRLSPLDQNTLLAKSSSNAQNMYYGTASYSHFIKSFSINLFSRYSHYQFYLYDQILKISDAKINNAEIANSLNSDRNLAFVSDNASGFEPEVPSINFKNKAEPVTRNSEQFRIINFDANSVKIETDLKKRNFLVFTDPFQEKWEAFINDNPAKLYRTNIAFKGLWIPEGKNTVFLRYSSLQDYAMKYFLFFIFYFCFGYLIFLLLNEKPKDGQHELF
ncbi:MAG: YfhO family protein [Candidatus Omnitrophica bacterium]|nr:YfhO family protein [Candidatus Omnitrophota bacterium]MBU1995965.1 YfhO family protein [Candidatus Omnitrophota bacterium]MBU4333772.1 YfhO family protein [Candidatus Omnitrophota bacterium]